MEKNKGSVNNTLIKIRGDFRNAEDFLGRFIHLVARRSSIILLALVAISVAVGCLMYTYSVRTTKKALVEQMLHRQQVISRAGAKSMENFLNYLGFQLSTYATRRAIINVDGNTQENLDEFTRIWAKNSPIVGIVLTDAKGTTIYNSNVDNISSVGTELSDRDYFKEIIEVSKPGFVSVGDPVISRLGSSKGQYIVPVATGVFDSAGRFKGILASAMLLSEATTQYLEPLKISYNSRVYLIADNGMVLSSPHPGLEGQNYFTYLSERGYKDTSNLREGLIAALQKGGEQKLDVYMPQEPDLIPTRYLIATAPVKYGQGKNWTLAVATPAEEAFIYAGPFAGYSTLSLVLFITMVMAFTFVLLIVIRVAESDSYLAGYNDGKKSKNR